MANRQNGEFQSTLPARGSDPKPPSRLPKQNRFNPRSPRGGATIRTRNNMRRHRFQSTLPARRSDSNQGMGVRNNLSFNPRSPRGGATCSWGASFGGWLVSIHAPREGERPLGTDDHTQALLFQSTLPARGSDRLKRRIIPPTGVFQSTLPARGSDGHAMNTRAASRAFQSTLPARGSDSQLYTYGIAIWTFQSTLPARGSDLPSMAATACLPHSFNPRSPRGGATWLPQWITQ